MGCLKVNERPVIVGGFTHSDGYCEAMSTALVYDSQSNSWNELGSLKFGRANAKLLYFEHQLFAFGGVRRGVFDSLSGHCDGEWINLKPLDLDSNSKLPMRLSYPVEQVEVMDLRELNLLSGQWKEMNKIDISIIGGTYGYVAAVLPFKTKYDIAKQVSFLAGGISNNYENISNFVRKSTEPCMDCFSLRDHVLVYDPSREDKSILIPIVIVLSCFIAVWTIIIMVRRYRRRKAIQEQEALREHGHLMLREFDWGHDEDELEFDDDYDSVKDVLLSVPQIS